MGVRILDRIKIRNLRSLKDTGYIDIRPLTILVGKNSSGKSTFLRFFPLMKQTLSTKKNEPILWYSKGNVDFGSFEESVNKKSEEKIIGFDFDFKINGRYRGRSKKPAQLSLKVDLMEKSIKRVSITIFENQIKLVEHNNSYKLSINNKEIENLFIIDRPDVFKDFLPLFVLKNQEDEGTSEKNIREKSDITDHFHELIYEYVLSKSEMVDKIEYQSKLMNDMKIFMRELTIKNIELIANRDKELIEKLEKDLNSHNMIFEGNIEFFFENNKQLDLFNMNESNMNSYENEIIKALKTADEKGYEDLNNLLFGAYAQKLIEICNEYLHSYFAQVHYIAPLRASAQRYYRIQGLAVDEIDPMGENIPMAINNLSSYQKKKFKKWMKENFGFQIETKASGGHVTLNISFDGNEGLNLADTGFGFSQILPILLLLWRVENSDEALRVSRFLSRYNKHNIVIEQPELHLHPALQALLTDALVKCIEKARERGIILNIIIETHSETIINRVGQLVYKEKIDKEKINILIFGDTERQNPSQTCLKSVSYDEEGVIEDWPLGFFYPEV
ncbi:hypothetical protein CN281_19255 [Bacillus cereus]|nr:hypothetical protein CN281_19255 [Bacillus cereus]